MNFLNKLERKFRRYAIHDLMKYIVALFIIGAVLGASPAIPIGSMLNLDFDMILQGQVWRIITWIIPISSIGGLLFTAIMIYFYFWIGNSLENNWGAFRFNLYIFTGILFNFLSSLVTYAITGISVSPGLNFICDTMFFAFAAIYPNVEVRLFFLVPIKIKYLAFLEGAIYIYNAVNLINMGQAIMILPLVISFANFLIYFFATRNYRSISPKEYQRKANYHRQMKEGRNTGNVTQFRGKNVTTRHKCSVCGRTEIDNDQLEFRFCSKCDGNYEYCSDHLYTHEHVHK